MVKFLFIFIILNFCVVKLNVWDKVKIDKNKMNKKLENDITRKTNGNSDHETDETAKYDHEEIKTEFENLQKILENRTKLATLCKHYSYHLDVLDLYIESCKIAIDETGKHMCKEIDNLKEIIKKKIKSPEIDIATAQEAFHKLKTAMKPAKTAMNPAKTVEASSLGKLGPNFDKEKDIINERIIENIKARKSEFFEFKDKTDKRMIVEDLNETKSTHEPEVFPYDLCSISTEKLLVVNFRNHIKQDLHSPNLLIYGVEPVRIDKSNKAKTFKDKLKLLSVYDKLDDIKQIPDKLKQDLMISRKIEKKNFRLRINSATTNKFNRIFLCDSHLLLVLIVDLDFNYKGHVDLTAKLKYKSETNRSKFHDLKSICFNNAFNNGLLFVSTFGRIFVFEIKNDKKIISKNFIDTYDAQIDHMKCINNVFMINYTVYPSVSFSIFYMLEKTKENNYNLKEMKVFVDFACAVGASDFNFYVFDNTHGKILWCDENGKNVEKFDLMNPRNNKLLESIKGPEEGSICIFNSKLVICDYNYKQLIVID